MRNWFVQNKFLNSVIVLLLLVAGMAISLSLQLGGKVRENEKPAILQKIEIESETCKPELAPSCQEKERHSKTSEHSTHCQIHCGYSQSVVLCSVPQVIQSQRLTKIYGFAEDMPKSIYLETASRPPNC